VWDGNEVWLLVAGGATFAAFPNWYATLFSGFYLPLFLILAALIFRGVAFEYRSKRDLPKWHLAWDHAIFWGSLVPSLLWGVAFANILRGTPIGPHQTYLGSFFNLLKHLQPAGRRHDLLLFALHGSIFLSLKTTEDIKERAEATAKVLAPAATLRAIGLPGMDLRERRGTATTWASCPRSCRSWPSPPSPVVGWLMREKLAGWAFIANAWQWWPDRHHLPQPVPAVMVSSISPAYNLTIGNTSSAPYTLKVMTIVALIFTPLVLVYQSWSYWVFRARVRRPAIGAVLPVAGPPATDDTPGTATPDAADAADAPNSAADPAAAPTGDGGAR